MRILIVQHGTEMYGSDRALLSVVAELVERRSEVTVAVPELGALSAELSSLGARVEVGPVGVVGRHSFTASGALRTSWDVCRAVGFLSELKRRHRAQLIYSNTLAVLGGAIVSRLSRTPHVWHVHESVADSGAAKRVLAACTRWSKSQVIFNSAWTARSWCDDATPGDNYRIILNGVPSVMSSGMDEVARIRRLCGADESTCLIVCVGRINRWKGQRSLLAAFERIVPIVDRQVRLLIVGAPPQGQPEYLHALEHKISESPVRRFVTLLPFQQNPAAIWNASDIAVVPSEEPEPFGLVAVEAMSASKPVVAAAHGGLVEIVVPAVTGELFEPRNESQLAEVLTRLVLDPQRRAELGRAGRARYQAAFTEERFAAEVCDLIACIISPDSKCQNMGSPT